MRSTLVLPLVLLGLAACGGGGGDAGGSLAACPTVELDGGQAIPQPTPTDPMQPDATNPSLSVSLDRATVRVTEERATYVAVRIHRGGGLAGDVTISTSGITDADLRVSPLVIPAGSDVGMLEVHAGFSVTSSQPSGAKVVARAGDVEASTPIALVHALGSGLTDTNFAGSGLIATSTLPTDVAAVVRSLPDGRFVVAGMRGGNAVLVQRYLANGQPDTTFFGSGEVAKTLGAGTHQVNALHVDPDGRALVGGFVGSTGFLARFLANGQPDGDFGSGGVAFLAGGSVQSVHARPDGRLVVVDDNGADCHLRGLDVTGQPDASFAGGQVVTLDHAAQDYCPTAALLSDGTLVVFGSTGTTGGFAMAYDAAGTKKSGFGSGGVCALEPNANAFVPNRSLVLSGDRMVVGGQVGNQANAALMLLSSDCHSWPAFGTDGYVSVNGLAGGVASDGRRLYFNTISGSQLYVCATFLDGISDRHFGFGGCGPGSALPGTEYVSDLAVTADGGLLSVGSLNLGAQGFDPFVHRTVGPSY